VYKTLCNLEKVTIWLKWSKFNVKCEWASRRNLLLAWTDNEWILNEFVCCFIQNLEQSPVNSYWEAELIL